MMFKFFNDFLRLFLFIDKFVKWLWMYIIVEFVRVFFFFYKSLNV